MWIIITGILIIVASVGYKGYKHFETQKLVGIPLNELTEEQRLKDSEFLYNTLYENYSLFGVINRKYGIDWLANKDEYIQLIKTTNNFE